MITRTALLLMVAVTLSPGLASAQDECRTAATGQACRIVIDRTAPVSGQTVKVESETRVTVILIKTSPFESCRNDVKREELPDISIAPALLGLVKDITGGLILFAARARPNAAAPSAAPSDIRALLKAVLEVARDQAQATADLQRAYDDESRKLGAFYRTRYVHSKYGGTERNEKAFAEDLVERQTAVAAADLLALPTLDGGETIYKAAVASFTVYARTAGANASEIVALEQELNEVRGQLDLLAKAVAALQVVHDKLHATIAYLDGLTQPRWEASVALWPDRNVKLTGSFSCASDVSGKPTLDPPIVYTVIFQNTPRLTLTAGVMVSWLPRNSVGIEQVADGSTGGVVTVHSEIREHPSSPQALPFSFLNIRLGGPWHWHGRIMTANLAPGLGVNSNDGNVAAEFFLGGTVGFDSLFLSVGRHAGHDLKPANGFEIGQRPPGEVKTVPLETPWVTAWAFAVSYRIPLK